MPREATRDYLTYFLASLIVLAGVFGIYDDVAVSAGGSGEAGAKSSLASLPEPFEGIPRLRFILVGADEKPNDVGRSDTLMVMWLNPARKRAAIMSIPRDLKTAIPGHGHGKINAAFAYGGAPLTSLTVEQLIGIPIDGYMKVNFEGFVKAVDLLGGVDLMVPDVEGKGRGMNYDDSWGNLHIHLTPGMHHMNGYEAMGYCRYRKSNIHGLGDGDGGRAARQQAFIKAMVEQKLKVTNVPSLMRAGQQIAACLETNLSWRQCVDLARLLKEMNSTDIKTVTIPVVDAPASGVYFSELIPSAYTEMMADIERHLESSTTSLGKVEVLNGSGRTGAAQQAADFLKKAGFEVSNVANAPERNLDSTRIRYRTGSQDLAHSAMMVLGTGVVEPASRQTVSPDDTLLQIVIGQDFSPNTTSAVTTEGRNEPGISPKSP